MSEHASGPGDYLTDPEDIRAHLLTWGADTVREHGGECHPVDGLPGTHIYVLAVADRPGIFLGVGDSPEAAESDAWLNLHQTPA